MVRGIIHNPNRLEPFHAWCGTGKQLDLGHSWSDLLRSLTHSCGIACSTRWYDLSVTYSTYRTPGTWGVVRQAGWTKGRGKDRGIGPRIVRKWEVCHVPASVRQ